MPAKRQPKRLKTTPPSRSRGTVHERTTRYQHISVKRGAKGLVLRLNGCLQVYTHEERLYHECIATMPLLLAKAIRRVAILGGGDGLAARNLLEFTDLGRATLVELDGGMLSMAKRLPEWRAITRDSLSDPRLEVVTGDAIAWFHRQRGPFDVVIHDLEMIFTDQPEQITIERCLKLFLATHAKLAPGGIWVLTVADDTPHMLADGVFEELQPRLPMRFVAAYRRARSVTAKVRVLLEAIFTHVREWTIRFPVLGSHATFYISNAPMTRLRRQPPVKLLIDKPFAKLR